jgi:ABC-type phosphate/phosphonate transport system substrate-binding protein
MDGVEMYLSSAHRASIEAVANGLADLAAIDAVSFTLAQRHMPEISEIEIVGCTRPTPGLPLISALPAEAVDRLASAVDEVIGSLSPSLRRELVLCGFVRRTAGDYAGIAEDWRHIGDHMLRQTQPSNQALQACR